MAARDDYPRLANLPVVNQNDRAEIDRALDEIDRLRGEIKARDKIDREIFGCD